jgi:hypothetical protein
MAPKRTITKKLNGTAWHKLAKEEMGGAVARLVSAFKTEQQGRRVRYKHNLELYERRRMNGQGASGYNAADGDSDVMARDRLGLVRSAIATAVSSVYAPQKPKPQFQTSGATWAIRRRAYKLDRICEGIINQRQGRWINVWALMTDAGCEAATQGVACIKVYSDVANKRVAHKLLPCVDIWFDPSEGRYPRCLYHREPIQEEEAALLWPKSVAAIRGAQPYEWYGAAGAKPRDSKTIELQFAYRLPDSPDNPGKWCAVIGGEVVDSGDWDAPSFPIVMLGWEPHREGPWYSGIADEGGEQAQFCSELYLRLQYRAIVASGKKIYYPRDTVKPDDLALNDAVVAVPYDGSMPPNESLSVPFSPTEMDFLQYAVQNFWDAIGVSQVSAAARREQGVSSGVAMMTLNDTKAGRQLVKAQRYEQAFVDLAHQYVWRLRELAEHDPELLIQWAGKRLIRAIKFNDADVEDDEFSVSVAPASALPHDPAGRQQMVSELYQQGMVSQETAKSLIGWPDLESEMSVENSEFEYVDALIEKYTDADRDSWTAGDYQGPEGFIINKPQALRRFAASWFRIRVDQMTLPEDEATLAEFNLGLLVRYIKELDALMNPPAVTAPGGQPMGSPPTGPLPPGALPPPAPGMLPPGMVPPPPGMMPNAA